MLHSAAIGHLVAAIPLSGLFGLWCTQGRIKGGGQRRQLPRAPRCKVAPRDEIYLFQRKYSFENFS